MPYYLIYKNLLAAFDMLCFTGVVWWLIKQKRTLLAMAMALVFYITAGYFIKDFYFDSYDLVFSGVWFGCVLIAANSKTTVSRLISYVLFWLTVGLKYINLPLGLIYWLITKKKRDRGWVWIAVAFFLVWLPVVGKFGVTLASTYRIHADRGLQVESLPASIIRLINSFTRTESFTVKANAVEIVGPLTSHGLGLFTFLFIGGLIAVLGWLGWQLIRKPIKKININRWLIGSTLVYLFTFMAFGKILSTPYLIWPMLFLAVYPFQTIRKQILIYIWYLIVVYLSSNPVNNLAIGITNLHTIIGLTRGLSLLTLAFIFERELFYEKN